MESVCNYLNIIRGVSNFKKTGVLRKKIVIHNVYSGIKNYFASRIHFNKVKIRIDTINILYFSGQTKCSTLLTSLLCELIISYRY